MPDFVYTGHFNSGRPASGTLHAINEDAAIQTLSNRGIKVDNIKDKRLEITSKQLLTRFLGIGKASPTELMNFSRQMHVMARSGVPIIRSMRLIADATKGANLKEALYKVAQSLESGHNLSAAMKEHHVVFPTLMIAMVEVGESTGNLDAAFEQISNYLEKDIETSKRVKSALRYPMFVVATILVAMLVVNIFVIPSFKSFFSDYGAELPVATRILIALSDATVKYWHFLILAVLGAIACFQYYKNTPQGSFVWSRLILKVPVFGSILYRALLGRFCRSFSMMLSSGVPLLQALTVVSKTVESAFIGQKIMEMRSGIEKGESLSRSAIKTDLFTPLIVQMITIGEETGHVDSMLEQVAFSYESEVDYELKGLAQSIEPILIFVIAGMVLVLALGIFLPMWNISGVALHGT